MARDGIFFDDNNVVGRIDIVGKMLRLHDPVQGFFNGDIGQKQCHLQAIQIIGRDHVQAGLHGKGFEHRCQIGVLKVHRNLFRHGRVDKRAACHIDIGRCRNRGNKNQGQNQTP